MIALTEKQRDLLTYLESYISRSGGIAPTHDEICAHLNIASKSGVNRLLAALEERGRIRRFPHRARAIEIVDLGPLHTASNHDLIAEARRRGFVLQSNPEVMGA